MMIILRKVARSSFFGKEEEFNIFWPLPDKFKPKETKIDFSSPEYKEWYRKMQAKNLFK